MKNIKPLIYLGIFTAIAVLVAVAVYPPGSEWWMGFFKNRPFLTATKAAGVAAFVLLIFKLIIRLKLPHSVLKLAFGVLFLPVLLLPLFRCYFKVPYVFCRVCPSQCAWGFLRTFLFNSFILLNLPSGKFWCMSCCPFGTFQECQTRVSHKRLKVLGWLGASAYVALILTAGMYFLTLTGSKALGFFEFGRYEWAGMTILVAGMILVAAFFIPMFWCRYLCPVGTIEKLTANLRKPFSKT